MGQASLLHASGTPSALVLFSAMKLALDSSFSFLSACVLFHQQLQQVVFVSHRSSLGREISAACRMDLAGHWQPPCLTNSLFAADLLQQVATRGCCMLAVPPLRGAISQQF